MKNNLFGMALWAALYAAFLFLSWYRYGPNQWLAIFVYLVVLMAASFFGIRWISKQPDQLKARYRVTNISMWISLLLAFISVVPNIFITGEWDKTAMGMIGTISLALLGANFARRHQLLRELAEREKSHATNDSVVRNLAT